MELKDLKVGDNVYCSNDAGWVGIAIIERLTDTQIIIKGVGKFNRTTGRSIGTQIWNGSDIKPLTPELEQRVEKYRVERKRQTLANNLSNFNFRSLTMEQLKSVAELVGIERK